MNDIGLIKRVHGRQARAIRALAASMNYWNKTAKERRTIRAFIRRDLRCSVTSVASALKYNKGPGRPVANKDKLRIRALEEAGTRISDAWPSWMDGESTPDVKRMHDAIVALRLLL